MIKIHTRAKILIFLLVLCLVFTPVFQNNIFKNKSEAAVKHIKLSLKSKKIRSDKTFIITATLQNPKNKVVFKSENKKIATVKKEKSQPLKSEGKITAKVTAKKKGKVNIVAYISGKKNRKAVCKVNIYQRVKASKITFAKKAASVAKGKTVKLAWNMKSKSGKKPNDKVTLTSSKKSIATVTSKGTVKGVNPGTATITVKTESKKKDTVKVTVYTIKAKSSKLKLTTGMSRTLTYYKYKIPSDTSITFTTSNAEVATPDETGLISAQGSGTCTITAKVPDGSKAKTTVTVTPNPVIVDLSKWQGTIDFAKARGAIDFAILRTQDGMQTSVEFMYPVYSILCKQNDVPFGVYEFSRFKGSSANAKKEAKLFYETATADGRKPSIFFLDIEIAGFTKTSVRAFIKELRTLAKPLYKDRVKVGVYVGQAYYKSLDLERDTEDLATPDIIWVPRYGKNTGDFEDSYEPIYPCDIWQYTSLGNVPGIKGDVDMNSLVGLDKKKISNKDWFTFAYLVSP